MSGRSVALDVAEHQALEPAVVERRPAAFGQTSLFDFEPAPAIAAPPELPAAEVRDPRQMAFSVVGRGAATRLRSTFDGKRLTTALAVYGALTQLASEARSPGEVRARRKDVAAYAGVTDRTVDLYARKFEEIGLLEVVRRRGGRDHTPNVWRLLQVEGDVRGEASRTPTGVRGEANDTSNDVRGEASRTPFKKNDTEENGNVVHLRDRSRVPTDREQRRARRERRTAALDALLARGDR